MTGCAQSPEQRMDDRCSAPALLQEKKKKERKRKKLGFYELLCEKRATAHSKSFSKSFGRFQLPFAIIFPLLTPQFLPRPAGSSAGTSFSHLHFSPTYSLQHTLHHLQHQQLHQLHHLHQHQHHHQPFLVQPLPVYHHIQHQQQQQNQHQDQQQVQHPRPVWHQIHTLYPPSCSYLPYPRELFSATLGLFRPYPRIMEDQPAVPQPESSTPPPAPMGGKRVYVGNLSWDTRWQGLKDHMRDAGEVVHAEVFTEASGRSAGCGIVEFETPADAQNAINSLNDSELDGRTIFVRADREEGKPSRHSRYNDNEGSSGGADSTGGHHHHHHHNGYGGRRRDSDRGRKIVIWNLPYHYRWQDLKDYCRTYGNVIRADIPQRHDGKSKGMGTVLFENTEDAFKAIKEMSGREVGGRIVDCRLDKFA